MRKISGYTSKDNNAVISILSPFSMGSNLKGKSEMCFESGPEVIKLFLCSTQLSMKFFLLIIVKMPTVVGILTFMSRKNSILGLSEPN